MSYHICYMQMIPFYLLMVSKTIWRSSFPSSQIMKKLLVRESISPKATSLLQQAALFQEFLSCTTLQVFKEPTKYIGSPLYAGKCKASHFSSIVDEIKLQTQFWMTRFLSPGGKVVLIKSILQSIPTHILASCIVSIFFESNTISHI